MPTLAQEKKLKKKENLEMMKQLASSRLNTSLLQSSRSLGVTKAPKREVLRQALKETRAGINVEENRNLLFKDEQSESESSEAGATGSLQEISLAENIESSPPALHLGSGLKRSLQTGSDGNPVIKKRRRDKKPKVKYQVAEEISWVGLDSGSESVSSIDSTYGLPSSQATQTDSNNASDGQSSEPSDTDEIDENARKDRKERSSAFKAWATTQLNEALGFAPTTETPSRKDDSTTAADIAFKPREPEGEPLPPELETNKEAPQRAAFAVEVSRAADIEEARLGLPIVAEEQRIMEAIYHNPIVVIWGETGSGKTTQVPQFLYEAGFGHPDSPNPGMIGVTQPRRVAAVSMAKRVADELGGLDGNVSHQIRFDSSVGRKTTIKFMTDGILIREIAKDLPLLKYSVIVIDEAHERSSNTDILIGLLSRIVDLRQSMSQKDDTIKPLKLIIMSATLRIKDFLENPILFRNGPPPLIQVEGRQHPVTVHFARRTQRDYVGEAYEKISKGHNKLPPGGMLVFLTGQEEIIRLAMLLKDTVPDGQGSSASRGVTQAIDAQLERGDYRSGNSKPTPDDYEDEAEEEDPFANEDEKDFDIGESAPTSCGVHILPLYSQLQTKDQLRVFETPPDNTRMIVLATNVAETSLTIPGIRYVFDCGRMKEKRYDRQSAVQSFEVGWISKASAAQRAGRAGRTGPGHCYRLYSSAIYERDFEEHAEPEILRMPVEGVVMQLKSMEIHHVVNFPFPTPPDRQRLAKAEKLLMYLGAISSDGKITPDGRQISQYPLSPRFAKMLTIGHQHDCMPYTIALVASLATPNMFLPEAQLDRAAPAESDFHTTEGRLAEDARSTQRSAYNHAHHLSSKHSDTSDAVKAVTALLEYAQAPDKDLFCEERFLSPKRMAEAANLFAQLASIVQKHHPQSLPNNPSLRLPPPSKTHIAALQQFTAAAIMDHIAILASESPSPPSLNRTPTRAIDTPYLPLFPIDTDKRKEDTDIIDKAVFIHPSSVLARRSVKKLPMYIIYSHLQRGSPSTMEGAKKPRTRMHALTTVTGKKIAHLARGTPLLAYGKPIGKVEESIKEGRRLRTCWVVPSLVGEKGRVGWPLPAQKVVQARSAQGDWVVENIVE